MRATLDSEHLNMVHRPHDGGRIEEWRMGTPGADLLHVQEQWPIGMLVWNSPTSA